MQFSIGSKRFDTEKVNFIAIDGQNILAGINMGHDGYYVTIKLSKGAQYNIKSSNSIKGAKAKIIKFDKVFRKAGLNNFIYIENKFLINLDNVDSYHYRYNLAGRESVWVEFGDGSEYALYEGIDEKYADRLYKGLKETYDIYKKDVCIGK